ncbi:MSHA pilin protein MshC [Tamilnaduibacter salinus]|uniref:MSHA pilin protein MshC n=2 Tax=Tamilnaduibacter salinus TaxID=1484056 RepID=A0A2U1CTY9_9GAMM|nr:MSHA pilin protein MshC [Tamilnaduibacter salinus]
MGGVLNCSMPTKAGVRDFGFTLVELIMVLILIGVLAALGIGLFANRAGFTPLLATQQLASAVSLAQQAALAGNAGDSVAISQSGDELTFTVGAGTAAETVFSLPREGVTVSGPASLAFQKTGALASNTNETLTFSGDGITYTTCVSSLGAVYRGGCQP